jgi:hypothetical protein
MVLVGVCCAAVTGGGGRQHRRQLHHPPTSHRLGRKCRLRRPGRPCRMVTVMAVTAGRGVGGSPAALERGADLVRVRLPPPTLSAPVPGEGRPAISQHGGLLLPAHTHKAGRQQRRTQPRVASATCGQQRVHRTFLAPQMTCCRGSLTSRDASRGSRSAGSRGRGGGGCCEPLVAPRPAGGVATVVSVVSVAGCCGGGRGVTVLVWAAAAGATAPPRWLAAVAPAPATALRVGAMAAAAGAVASAGAMVPAAGARQVLLLLLLLLLLGAGSAVGGDLRTPATGSPEGGGCAGAGAGAGAGGGTTGAGAAGAGVGA